MAKQEDQQSNDIADGKITTFASPAVLAAILDEESLNEDEIRGMVDINEQERESERVDDSLESSLNDSLELTKLQDSEDVKRVDPSKPLPLEIADQNEVLDFPKSPTPVQNSNETNRRKIEKPPKPRRPQHIIERNKDSVGKKMPVKTSYARMHATKTRNKLENMEDKSKKHGGKSLSIVAGSVSGLGNQSEHLEEIDNDLDQSSYFHGHSMQGQHDLEYPVTDEQEIDLQQDSYYSSMYHNQHHGPYYDVSQNSSLNYGYEPSYLHQPTTYARGYQSAMASSRQSHASHAMAGPISLHHYNPLSTQSAPPGGYGYHRKLLISDTHHLYEEDSYLSSALPNNSERGNKLPESSLHRKFSSEPYLLQSSSPLQKMTNVGRNSKASGSYSSLRQPFQYKPYTLKDYKNIAGVNVEHIAGGLGPNVDTDEFKEKMRKVSKQREYAAMLRSQHSVLRKQQERKASTQLPVKPKHVKEAEIKRKAALNYAKNVPKPKQMASRKRDSPAGSGQYRDSTADDNQDITILEILRMRHEKEKKEVDTIRKDLASKIRL